MCIRDRQMKRPLRGMSTAHTATTVADAKTGNLQPRERGTVSTWCKKAWAMIAPEVVKMCFKICGLMLALGGSEDHAWCTHNFGEGYRELVQQQRMEWEAAHSDATLPPLQLPVAPDGEVIGTNPITAAEKEVEGKLLPRGEEGENDVELLEDDSDVEFLGGGGKEGCLLYTSPSPRDQIGSRMPSSA